MSKTNKLLVQGDYPLIASPTLAQAYGMAAATFLQKLHYCLQNSETKTHQSKKYFFHSYEQWVETLGFYSVSTIKRVISKLKQDGILLVKKLSKNKWLQTNYYAIDYKKLKQQLSPKIGQVEDVSTESMTQTLECSKQAANHVVQTVCIFTSAFLVDEVFIHGKPAVKRSANHPVIADVHFISSRPVACRDFVVVAWDG